MTREEIKGILKDITDEQLGQVLDLNSRDIGKAKGKAEDQKAELERLTTQLAEKDAAIAALEVAKGDAAAIQAELDKYKQAEADRRKAEKEAETDRILTAAAEVALEGKEFINDYTRTHFLSELKKAIADPANKGKAPAKLFEDLTRDADGIFKNPQQEPLKIPGVDRQGGQPLTKADIYKKDDKGRYVMDAAARQSALAKMMSEKTE